MENTIIFTAEEKGFIVEADGKRLWVSYDEFHGNHKEAVAFCKEQGGGDETAENLRFIARYRNAINEELKKLGKEIIRSWYWTNEITWWSGGCAFVVYTDSGNVIGVSRDNDGNARAISIL